MIQLFLLVEEESMVSFLNEFLPKIMDLEKSSFQILQYSGKIDLENSISKIVSSLSRVPNARILIAHDQDSNDCRIIKNRLFYLVEPSCLAPFKIRILCHELENWFLGDFDALSAAFPKFRPEQYRAKAQYRAIDNIANAPQELLRIVPELAGQAHLPKIKTATLVSPHLLQNRNRSTSFQHFVRAVQELTVV